MCSIHHICRPSVTPPRTCIKLDVVPQCQNIMQTSSPNLGSCGFFAVANTIQACRVAHGTRGGWDSVTQNLTALEKAGCPLVGCPPKWQNYIKYGSSKKGNSFLVATRLGTWIFVFICTFVLHVGYLTTPKIWTCVSSCNIITWEHLNFTQLGILRPWW